jgi:hypothetical protein
MSISLQIFGMLGMGAVSGWVISGCGLSLRTLGVSVVCVSTVVGIELVMGSDLQAMWFVYALVTVWVVRYVVSASNSQKHGGV